MNNFIAGALTALAAIIIALVLCGVPNRDSHTLRVLNICEKSLPRDQKCIIVAIPKVEQKALNEIKGEMK